MSGNALAAARSKKRGHPAKLRVIDLFCGAGGMTLGFTDARFGGGFASVLALDNDKAAVQTHAANFSGAAVCADIEAWLKTESVPEADVVIGGPPCQGFSLLNKNRTGDERRGLWEPFLEIANKSRARVFVMENVKELLSSPELHSIERRAKAFGFRIVAEILNTADYGSPQTRKRTIIVGFRNVDRGAVTFPPPPTHTNLPHLGNLQKWRTVKDVIADLPPPKGIEIGSTAPLDLHFGRTPKPLSVKRYKAVPRGGNRFDLQRKAPELTPECWKNKKSGGTDLFGRLWWDRPSVTIRTEFYKPEKGRYLHPDQHRPITHREAARLMGFPDDFKFVGSKVEIARQIGNGVPPHLAGAIARVVYAMLMRMEKAA